MWVKIRFRSLFFIPARFAYLLSQPAEVGGQNARRNHDLVLGAAVDARGRHDARRDVHARGPGGRTAQGVLTEQRRLHCRRRSRRRRGECEEL